MIFQGSGLVASCAGTFLESNGVGCRKPCGLDRLCVPTIDVGRGQGNEINPEARKH